MTKTQLSICLNNAEVRIAELKKENELLKRVEDIFNASPDLTFDCCKKLFTEDFQAHNLEQQATACDWVYKNVPDLSNGNYMVIQNRARQLRSQAKELKE